MSIATVELISIRDLEPHPHNPRGPVTGDPDLEGLAASIREQGILQPLICAADGPPYRIIAGHRRLAAARLRRLVALLEQEIRDLRELAARMSLPRSAERVRQLRACVSMASVARRARA